METLAALLGAVVVVACFLGLLWAVSAIRGLERRLGEIDRRLEALGGGGPAPAVPPAIAAPAPPLPTAPPPPPAPAAPLPAAPPAPLPSRPARRLEDLVGGVWLQNAGSVLVLVGVFFLILWGYTTGRFGPGVLVAAGVALGLVLAWRGDRVTRSLPAFGYALLGIGLGAVYLSLYVGHFTLHVLPGWAALVLLALTSLASVGVGLHYRVQTIAALGVAGAFLPELIGPWVPLQGFAMGPAALLGYLAVVDLAVFALAARAGWSGLDLAALLLSVSTWTAGHWAPVFGWSMELGLSALFVLLGLAPAVRVARAGGPARPIDVAVIAVAPLCLIVASWPFLAATARQPVGGLLMSLAAVYALAAAWTDEHRAEQDLWRPLIGATTLFLTAGLQRLVGRENTAMTWCVEGVLLTALGLRARGGWLRLCGYAVTALGSLWMLFDLANPDAWSGDRLPVVSGPGLRELVCLVALLAGSHLLARGRSHLSRDEHVMPEAWAGFGNLALAVWLGREAGRLAARLEPLPLAPAFATSEAPARSPRAASLAWATASAAWLAQSGVLLARGMGAGRGFLRACGHVAGVLMWMGLFFLLAGEDAWRAGELPILHLTGVMSLACIAVTVAVAARLAARRPQLDARERRASEVWTLAANLLLLAWSAREADHLARSIGSTSWIVGWLAAPAATDLAGHRRTLIAVFASLAWTAQAVVLLVLGWRRASEYLRWLGLGLFGLTALKLVFHDLQTVDVFWRFLVAIVVGAVLLGVSYAYQRRLRRLPAGPAGGP